MKKRQRNYEPEGKYNGVWGWCPVCRCTTIIPCIVCSVRRVAQPKSRSYRDDYEEDTELRPNLGADETSRYRRVKSDRQLYGRE